MPLSHEARVRLAERFLAIGPKNLTSDTRFRQILEDYIQSGDVQAIASQRVRAMIERMDAAEIDKMTPDQIDQLVRGGLSKYLNIIVKDPNTREFMQDLIGNAPFSQDRSTIERYVTDSVMSHVMAQAGPNAGHVGMSWGAMQATMAEMGKSLTEVNFDDPEFQNRYFSRVIQDQYPNLNAAETRRAIEEYKAISTELGMWGDSRSSFIPEGCVLPLTFLAVIAFLYGVMGLLLLVMLGTVALPAFWQTKVGQALNATLFLMALISGIYGWLRRQGIRNSLLTMIFGGLLLASVGLVVVQLVTIDTEALSETVTTDADRTIGAAVFGLSILVSGFLWLRARTLNLLIIGVLLAAIVGLVVFAQQSGILDLTDINLDILNNTSTDGIGFE